MKRVAINGMGRMGRCILRQYLDSARMKDGFAEIDLIAINDLASIDDIAYLLRYDSVHGKLSEPVVVEDDYIRYQNHRIRYVQTAIPRHLPWRELEVETVIEATGAHTSRHDAAEHITAGAHRVLIAAPSEDAEFTLCMGVNETSFDPGRHHVISNASCTTNSLVPALKILLDTFGVEEVSVTTVHAYTASQSVVDTAATKKHRGRAAALSIIPTSTGADKATLKILPQLKGRIRANALRVPVPDGSITDITAVLTKSASAEQINGAFKEAVRKKYAGIFDYSEEELVSSDIIGERYSGILHARATQSTGRLAKVQVWYDNEVGYATRCLDALVQLPI